MILNTVEIKNYLGITSNDYDSRIELFREPSHNFLIDYCKNELHNLFLDDYIYCNSTDFVFTASGKTVYAEGTELFTDNPFQVSDYVYIDGSANNNGMFQLSAVTADTLTFSSDDTIVTEDSDLDITISKMNIPGIFKLVFAQLVWENVTRIKNINNVKSESLGPHSRVYGNNMNAYSDTILNKLAGYNQAGI